MPGPDLQPDYYAMLRDAAGRARNPAIHVLAAVDPAGEPVGSVDFIDDMAQYGAGGRAVEVADAAGIRLLAVRPDRRGAGIGKALTRACIDRARALGRSAVVLHTTRAMQTAWAMYERLGFARAPALDFRQGDLDVFGFRLDLPPRP
jgi:GNAT superfamily N-acetyltransferase